MVTVDDPFPHVVLDDWFGEVLLDAVLNEFPPADDPRWKRYDNAQEIKLEGGQTLWGPATLVYFERLGGRTPELETMFGIRPLTMELTGGGYHLIPEGGLLAMHSDFNRSGNLYRRLNVLTYLNRDWTDPGGHLLLGADCEVDITPEFGRTVAFATSSTSWHGHPHPAQRDRRSVAAYFFSPDPPPGYSADQSTVWL